MLKPPRQVQGLLSRISGLISPADRPAAASAAAVAVPITTAKTRHTDAPCDTRLADHLSIPNCDPQGDPASAEAQDRGQFLARQERWDELSNQIRAADEGQTSAGCGLPLADLIAYGARADVVHATEDALAEGRDAGSRTLIRGLMAFEALRAEHRNDPYLTALVALAHIDIGWAWRGPATGKAVPQAHQRRCAAHFDRAAALLDPIAEACQHSPFLKAAQCALFAGRPNETLNVADEFATLIALDPGNHRPMRTLGTQMLPRNCGSYAALELEARRTAARTADSWGAGGYTWVYFDALALDGQACARVDTRFFIDGLRDIVAAVPSQEMVNMLAAYCTVTLRRTSEQPDPGDAQRATIAAAADWLIRDHLKELHPLVWAHATEGFDNSTRVSSVSRFAARGQAGALEVIAAQFRKEIEGGQKVAFTAEGLEFHPT